MQQKPDDFIPTERFTIRLKMQLDLAPRGSHTQPANQIQALIMIETRAHGRRLPARCPRPLERRHQGKACFIRENEGRPKFTPLFLSVARHSVSNARWLHRLAPDSAAGAFGNSNPVVAGGTTRRSTDSALGTDPRSNEQCDRGSSNLLHNRAHRLRVSKRTPSVEVAQEINDWDIRAHVSICGEDAGTGDAIDTHSGVSRQLVGQSPLGFVPVATNPVHADDAV